MWFAPYLGLPYEDSANLISRLIQTALLGFHTSAELFRILVMPGARS